VGKLQILAAVALIGCLFAHEAALGDAGGTAPGDGVSSMARAIKQSNENYLGWRLFQEKCARCHGKDETGTAQAPSLLVRLKSMDERQFIDAVLRRYGWAVPGSDAQGESGSRDALIQALIDRKDGAVRMPAWEGEPSVNAHIDDLYQFLKARSDGLIGPERPPSPRR
jgi:hypothetical protein